MFENFSTKGITRIFFLPPYHHLSFLLSSGKYDALYFDMPVVTAGLRYVSRAAFCW